MNPLLTHSPITLEGLPERGEADVEFEAPDAETYQVLSRLQQEAVVGREVRQEQRGVADLRRPLTEVEDLIVVDPSGFRARPLPEDTRTQVAKALLFSPGVLEETEQRLAQHRAVRDVLAESGGQESRLAEVLANPTGAEPKRRRIPENSARRSFGSKTALTVTRTFRLPPGRRGRAA